MRPKRTQESQGDLYRARLDQILNSTHPLIVLSDRVNWRFYEESFGGLYVEDLGRPGLPIRLMVGLHYLKHAFNESDESVAERFLENPYWQYFCGFEYFQHKLPFDPTSLVKWRRRVGSKGMEKLLFGVIETLKEEGLLKKTHLRRVNVDTTVQEKAVAYPTDARLYHKMRERLVREAEKRGVELRQTYRRLGKEALQKQGRYAHAKQFQRARRETRRLKTYLGRVFRDIRRKVEDVDVELLELADRLLRQQQTDKNKLYCVHAPEVECISKGKVHKRYEFGSKVSLVTTSKDNWIVGIQSLHGNPFDGHTLKSAMEQVTCLTGWTPDEAFCDKGYRGADKLGLSTEVHLPKRRTSVTRSFRKWLRRRSAVEPVIGHIKADHRMDRNYLKGREGDRMNALLAACGYNLRKLLRVFLRPIFERLSELFSLPELRLDFGLYCRNVLSAVA